ncbi:hypothetical protein EPN16_01200 [bacterium]|nr:MAG: hypothetical protein EPN16_01200 [bacterium]
MSFLMPAFPRAAFGEVGFPPIAFMAHLLLQNFLPIHLSAKNAFLQREFAHTVFILGTFITPLNGLFVPFSELDIFNRVSREYGLLFLLLTLAEQFWLQ